MKSPAPGTHCVTTMQKMNWRKLVVALFACVITSCTSTESSLLVQQKSKSDMAELQAMVAKDKSWKKLSYFDTGSQSDIGIPEEACRIGRFATVRFLVQHGAELRKFREPYASSSCLTFVTAHSIPAYQGTRMVPADEAKINEIIETLDFLLSHGATLGKFEPHLSPLSFCDNAKVARYWINKGLNPLDGWSDALNKLAHGAQVSLREPPLGIAALTRSFDVFKLYIDTIGYHRLSERDKGTLMFLIVSGDNIMDEKKRAKKLRYIIQQGGNPTKYRNQHGRSIMDVISSHAGSSDKAEMLRIMREYLEQHGDINEQDIITVVQ